MAPPKSILVIGVALLLSAVSATEQKYIPYSYTGATGPEKWGSLSSYYSACSSGKAQSPINIVKKDVVVDPKLQTLLRNYSTTNATLINNGFNIGLRYGNGVGAAKIDGKPYSLKQLHWHTPSEHTIDGQRFPAELHLVHVGEDGSIAVVAILFEYGHGDPLLYLLHDSLKKLTQETCSGDSEAQVPITLKAKPINKKSKKYYRYIGSLTTPPCFENVTWSILGKVRQISKEQVEALKAPLTAPFKNNSRPTQPLNGRKVELYNEFARN
ncbi:Carbonic anhydrase [Thalictrum thalictroides]|uniref:Carbonic anhydrase n=1 Tax=Thalictrum thalictroides TaxID=46969 RepID=A0A7J6VFI5_THATH|nr:Carbonic anhydrase [Thalictrum thalictroides]